MDVAPIAEDFFKRLLHATDPGDAIMTLSSIWQVRSSSTGPWFGLSRPEHQVTMVLIYTGEVGNGGHQQFFSNRGSEITIRVEAAVRELGLRDLEAILRRACAVRADGRNFVDRLLGAWGRDRFAELDRQAWALEDVDSRLLTYLREHESEVLRPERRLDRPL